MEFLGEVVIDFSPEEEKPVLVPEWSLLLWDMNAKRVVTSRTERLGSGMATTEISSTSSAAFTDPVSALEAIDHSGNISPSRALSQKEKNIS